MLQAFYQKLGFYLPFSSATMVAPTDIAPCLSENKRRNRIYASCLAACQASNITFEDIVEMGASLMQKSRLHHHFYADFSFLTIARHLAAHALNISPSVFFQENLSQLQITENQAKKIIALFEKRIAHKIPVEYITNEAHYLGNTFYVNENVLVPRSIMNNRFQDFLHQTTWENNRVLDLCTGSGCIGITLALLNPNITVDLVDISEKALEVAQININKYALNDRVRCIQSDVFSNVSEKYDLIITNPPYVSTKEYQASPDEFKQEPKIALECGSDGLDIIHEILRSAKKHLNPQGRIIAEIGYPAAQRVKKHYAKVPFKWYKYRRPNGKESLLGMHGVFECAAQNLP